MNWVATTCLVGTLAVVSACQEEIGSTENPHEFMIVARDDCPVDVDTGNSKRCKATTTKYGKVEGACTRTGHLVRWSTDTGEAFEISFEDENPMQDRCPMKSSGEPLECRIHQNAPDGPYKYAVVLSKCDEPLDPHIIVRRAPR